MSNKLSTYCRLSAAILSIFVTIRAAAVEMDMTFRHLNVADGLSQNTVLAIEQDRQGNIWFGTQNGINVYDGYEFRTFYSHAADSLSLPNNSIMALLMGSDGRMWIGTASGLSSYDFSQRVFRRHPHGDAGRIHSIAEADGRLILSTDQGLWYYDPDDGRFSKETATEGRLVHSTFYSDGVLLIASDRGLLRLEGDKVQEVEAFAGMDIYAIAQIGGTGWWIGTYGNGLYRTDSRFNVIRHYGNREGGLPSDYIRIMKTDGYGRLWVGTYDGLAVYDDLNGRFRTYTHSDNPSSISHNSVRSIFVDAQKGVWVGTWFGGVNYWNRQDDKLRTIRLPGKDIYGFISCLTDDPGQGLIWVGTNDDGIWRYYPDEERLEQLDLKGASGNIKCILPCSDGYLYAGTHLGGLLRIDKKNGRLASRFDVNEKLPINNGCYSLLEHSPGKLWVGTLAGLLTMDLGSGRFDVHPAALLEPRLRHSLINCMLRDNRDQLWIGTDSGLYLYLKGEEEVRDTKELIPGLNLGDIHVNQILQDRSGNVWVASKQGLIRFRENGEVQHYDTAAGLPNDQVCALLDDDTGLVWLTTGAGLCSLDPDSGAIRCISHSSKNGFNQGAGCAGHDGHFYFGSLGGITRFRPHDMYANPFSPKPFFSEAEVSGKGSGEMVWDDNGNLTSLVLSPETNMFTVRWSVVNPLSYGDNVFSYVLDGFDENRYETRSRQVSYSNLPAGKYTLRLKAANNEAVYCKEEAVLALTVLPHWWERQSAKMLFILLGAILTAGVFWLISTLKRTRLELKTEIREREMAEDNLSQTRDLLMRQLSPFVGKTVSADEEFLKKATKVVEDNIDNENFSSEDFARQMLMSRSNLYLRITAITGESATQFIRKIRFNKACQLLRERSHSIAEISAMVGFSSPSYFATSFKKNVGCLPTEYVRQQEK